MENMRLAIPGRADLVKKYLDDFSDLPSLTISKLMVRQHPKHFLSVENARRMVRYYRGQSGGDNRRRAADKSRFTEPGTTNPFDDIPEGLKHFDEWKPYEIRGEKALRLADAHVPYHDKQAIETALRWGLSEGVDTIILDDWLDFFAVSFWEKDPDKRNLQNELDTSRQILTIIRDMFPDAEIVWNKGNHEARYDRYMKVKAPELLGVREFSFENITGAEDLGIVVVDDKMFCKMGELNIVHGHEFGRSIFSPVNPARGLYLRAKTHCIADHWHQTSEHKEKDLNGDVIGCWTVGCLCDMRPDYAPVNKWNHGAAIVYRTGAKSFRVVNKTIIDGELY